MEAPNYENFFIDHTFLGRDIFVAEGKTAQVDMYFTGIDGIPSIVMRYGSELESYVALSIKDIISNENIDTTFVRNMLISEDKNLWDRKKI